MQRQLKYGANTVLAVIMFTAILVLINVLPRQIKVLNVFGMRVPLQKEFDLTENKKWSLELRVHQFHVPHRGPGAQPADGQEVQRQAAVHAHPGRQRPDRERHAAIQQ
jgi:hypothetical protein